MASTRAVLGEIDLNKDGATATATQPSTATRKLAETISFDEVVRKAGYGLTADGRHFQRLDDAATSLKTLVDSPRHAELLLKDMETKFEDDDLFRAALLPFHRETAGCSGLLGCESLVKSMLQVPHMQAGLVTLLIENVISKAASGDLSTDLENDIPRLVLLQLRWMDRVEDETSLCDQVVECISTLCSLESGVEGYVGRLKREFITALPEIVTDQEHGRLVDNVQQFMQEDRDLTVPAIECLSNLQIPPSSMDNLRTVIFETLRSAQLEDVAVSIRFLLESVECGAGSKLTKINLIKELRTKFSDICRTCLGADRSAIKIRDSTLAVLRTLNNCFLAREDLAKLYFASVGGSEPDQELNVVDIWLLLFLKGSLAYEKSATKLLRHHIAESKAINVRMLRAAIRNQRVLLEPIFTQLLKTAELCLQARGGKGVLELHACGRALYTLLFQEFNDAFNRQEIIHALAVHCGIAHADTREVDSGLCCIENLVADPATSAQLQPFAEFIKSLVFNAERMTANQNRKLFGILSALSIKDKGSAWLHIMIRKLMTSCSDKQRKVGVIAAVQLMCTLTPAQHDKETDSCLLEDDSDAERLETSTSIFEMALRACRSSASVMCRLFDELATVIETGSLNEKMVELTSENLAQEFETRFVVDVHESSSAVASSSSTSTPSPMYFGAALSANEWMNLDKGESAIALNLLPMIAKGEADPRFRERLVYLCPLLRCMMTCKDAQENFDAVLGCPLLLPTEEQCKAIEPGNVGDMVCLVLFHAINWIREVISSFAAAETDVEIQKKLCTRLENLLHLESLLRTCIAENPSFRLPSYVDETHDTIGLDIFGKSGRKASKDEAFTQVAERFHPLRPLSCRLLTFAQMAKPSFTQANCLLTALYLGLRSSLKNNKSNPFGNSKTPDSPYRALPAEELLPTIHQCFPAVRSIYDTAVEAPFDEEDSGEDEEVEAMKTIQLASKSVLILLKCRWMIDDDEGKIFFLCLLHAFSTSKTPGEKPTAYTDEWANKLCKSTFGYFAAHLETGSNVLKSLQSSVTTFEILECLAKLQSVTEKQCADYTGNASAESFRMLSELSRKILEQPWSKAETSKSVIEPLVTLHLNHAPNSLNSISALVDEMEACLSESAKHFSSDKIATLTHNTFGFFYTPLMKAIINELDSLRLRNSTRTLTVSSDGPAESSDTEPSDVIPNADAVFTQISSATTLMRRLVSLTRGYSKRSVCMTAVKKGGNFIDKFLKKAMPFVTVYFKDHEEQVIMVLKTLQNSTRQLQNICTHGKTKKDASMMSAVPGLRKTLESLIFRTKQMLRSNDRMDMFWLGTLKNRNIDGSLLEDDISEEPTPPKNKRKSKAPVKRKVARKKKKVDSSASHPQTAAPATDAAAPEREASQSSSGSSSSDDSSSSSEDEEEKGAEQSISY